MVAQEQISAIKVAIIIAVLAMVCSCDPCGNNVTPSPSKEKGDIVFSAKTINNEIPAIYTVNTDGSSLKMIISNGVLFAAPSKNDRIAYIAKNIDGENKLMRAKLDGKEIKDILPNRTIGEYIFNDLVNPVIAPDGNIIAFSAGDGHLWETAYDGGLFSDISKMFCEGTTPSISPDSKFLAYFQGDDFLNALTLRIVDISTNPPLNVAFKEHGSGVGEYRGEPTISWSRSGNLLSYVITQSGADDAIYFDNKSLNDELVISRTGKGAFMPVFSPQEDRLVFCGRDGNIYLLILAFEPKIIQLTETSLPVINIYPDFSNDGKKIVYTRYYNDTYDRFSGVIEIFDIDAFLSTGRRKVNIVANNAFRAFWTYNN